MAKAIFLLVAALAITAVSAGNGRTLLQQKTVTQTAQATPALSTLVAALTKTGLADVLNDPNLVATVFAPTNDAFVALEKSLGYTQEQLLNSAILKPTLLYHVVPKVAAQSSSLTDNQVLATDLPGQSLTVYLKPSGVVISGVQTAANVTQANIVASKAIVHVVDTVLLPAQYALNGAPAPAPAMMGAMAPSAMG
ncbi:FAS1 domain-containing protein [Coccomyxa subellipsoidea C-169]|uniref:FAS1 domain-containing protein n=1 Tax=Coccomyxa subellipsoidea (strain C-169) TaxID=574566 RepID=I0Z067_COCSC|nr:FAS1 domain-containing protein [Coccomyxa subellipsoidea C-169]EIE24036.1 FAS1 domain-containing protein [Coccomyxa subellipsoidea C-169]|eukprot:XP_005648580.1 FAS1 domain-containing protein [Coccomyxa subellipsoidea C-169]